MCYNNPNLLEELILFVPLASCIFRVPSPHAMQQTKDVVTHSGKFSLDCIFHSGQLHSKFSHLCINVVGLRWKRRGLRQVRMGFINMGNPWPLYAYFSSFLRQIDA